MREIVGFVMGAAAGAAGALFVKSPEGRALVERLRAEARPEVERATTEWEPVLNEVARAVRLAVREVETATVDLRARIAEIAAAAPESPAGEAGEAGLESPVGEAGEAGAAGADPETARPAGIGAEEGPSTGPEPSAASEPAAAADEQP